MTGSSASTVAELDVVHAGPFVTVQDLGRPGHGRRGVPSSGPLDQLAHRCANEAVGNAAAAPALEVSLGGLVLDCVAGSITVAVAGGDFVIEHRGRHADVVASGWRVLTLSDGDRLSIRAGSWGSWATLAVAGDLQAPEWLGSSSTHSLSGFGGGTIVAGRRLVVEAARTEPNRDGAIATPALGLPSSELRVVLGPQTGCFAPEAVDVLLSSSYRLSTAYDRMGVRLEGPALPIGDALSIPSEPVLKGSIQVAGDGAPTLLLADHQTTGGYPKIATVVSADLDSAVRCRSGDEVRFVAVSADEAVAAARAHAEVADQAVRQVGVPGRDQRLRSTNLISEADALMGDTAAGETGGATSEV